MEGNTIDMTFGYPATSATGIETTLVDTTGFAYTSATGLFTKTGSTTPATCSVTYTESTALNIPPVISSATGGC